MKKIKYIFISIMLSVVFLGINNLALATVYPVSNVDIMVKQNVGGKVNVFKADKDGNFSATGLEDGTYDIYLYDEAQNPLASKVPAKGGTINGRVLFELKDNCVDDGKKVKNNKKVLTSAQTTKTTFTANNWDQEHLNKLKKIFQDEGILSQTLSVKDLQATPKDLKESIKKFQTKHNLPPVGVIGPRTLEKLNEI